MTKSAENSQPKSRQGYMDATDFFHELGEALGGNIIYSSIEDLLENKPCAKECGVVKVGVEFLETILDPNFGRGISFKDAEDKTPEYIESMHISIAHWRSQAKKLQEHAQRYLDRAMATERELGSDRV